MTDRGANTTIQAAVEARLPKRYRAELRFRAAGLAAIWISFAILVILLGSIAGKGIHAFTANVLELEVVLSEDLVDPDGDRSEASLRQGSYGRVLQNAMRAQFPETRNRRDLRSMFQLYTALNAPRLMEEVLENPDLVGTTYRFQLPISDDMDLYLKGQLVDDRTLDTRGELSVSVDGTAASLNSTQADFAPLVAEIRNAVLADAVGLEARAEAIQSQSGGDADAAADADALLQRAGALRASVGEDLDSLTLTDDMPSIIVEAHGGAVKVETLSMDGAAASGRRITAFDETAATTQWTLYVVDTPEARRRVPDVQIIWTRDLAERGVVAQRFNTYLFTNADSREPELAGVRGALNGSILTMLVAMALSVPVGVLAAIYLEEFAPKNRFTDLIEVNINNLAAVPSIVFGLLGLAVFINIFGLPRSAPVLGGVVLSLMTLPTIIIATRAALKAVPPSIRQAALGMGASQTQTVFHHVLPLAAPGILTGSIIGLARALGETAPLLMIGMVAFIADAPSLSLEGLTEPATGMPVQIFLWYDAAERAFEARAAAAILILLALMISFNALAVYLRRRFERRW